MRQARFENDMDQARERLERARYLNAPTLEFGAEPLGEQNNTKVQPKEPGNSTAPKVEGPKEESNNSIEHPKEGNEPKGSNSATRHEEVPEEVFETRKELIPDELSKETAQMRPHKEVHFRGTLAYTLQCREGFPEATNEAEPTKHSLEPAQDPPKTNISEAEEPTPKEPSSPQPAAQTDIPAAVDEPNKGKQAEPTEVPKENAKQKGSGNTSEPNNIERPPALDEFTSIAPDEQRKAPKKKKEG